MKWIKLVPIGLVLLFSVSTIGIVILPEFMIDKVKFPASIAYWSGFQKVRKLVPQQDPDQFLLVEHKLTDSAYHEVKPLDESQIKKMVNQLIPEDLASKNEHGKVILSSPNKKVMKDFQEHLKKELPEGWKISRSTSNPDAFVTGDLFTLLKVTPRLIEDESGDYVFEDHEQQRPVLFLFWIMETDLKVKEILSATANYKNPNITAVIEDIAKDLSKVKGTWKIALINTSSGSAESMLVTAAILKEMVNAKTGMTFLNKSDTGKHDTDLKRALGSDEKTKVPRHRLAQKFSESTGATAALIIEKRLGGHFYLELMELPNLNILAIGRSENQPKD